MDWIKNLEAQMATGTPRFRAKFREIIDLHHVLSEVDRLIEQCPPTMVHVREELNGLRTWFLIARDNAFIGGMRWLAGRIQIACAWARGVLGGYEAGCELHDESLRLISCEVCGGVSGVGCGYGCGARRACEGCRKVAPVEVVNARKLGYPLMGEATWREMGPRCWGCNRLGVRLTATCPGVPALGGPCGKPLCADCHSKHAICDMCTAEWKSARGYPYWGR